MRFPILSVKFYEELTAWFFKHCVSQFYDKGRKAVGHFLRLTLSFWSRI